jgi:indole-3-glycerol phosphate synthase
LTRERVAAAKARESGPELRGRIEGVARVPLSFPRQLREGAGIIAEIKRRSPSRGAIAPELDPVAVAGAYLKAGASALSVLTEPTHFGGAVDDLKKVREAFPPAALLMKDFVVDPYQILQARAFGADAVLLIVGMLSSEDLRDFCALALELGLTPLVEAHDQAEAEAALAAGASLVGINNRNLRTLQTDLAVSRRLISLKPAGAQFVSESGIDSLAAIEELRALGYDGFLIGTALMLEKDPERSLRALLAPLAAR